MFRVGLEVLLSGPLLAGRSVVRANPLEHKCAHEGATLGADAMSEANLAIYQHSRDVVMLYNVAVSAHACSIR